MIKGKFVGLRSIEQSDLTVLLHWRNTPELRRYFREYRELNSDHQQAWYESKVLDDKKTEMFAIVDLSTDELLGACGLCYIDWKNRCADFSMYIGKNSLYIDDHFADDAARQIISYGFSEIGLHRIWCETYDFDFQKQALLERLGFVLDGRHRETLWAEGRWNDSLFYSLLESDYHLLKR
ncbi:GNAT family N-acetyltransferase [Paenibacillus dendritiformis]|uniref:GNAT family N-acetyltransferase n=1 Tax=Paenibacillus dendritiformis TaxID=130049 RepID=UPI000DA956DB|nr:GNAT family protein [Paenibacillus dendritiformis]PZM67281.1 N-acetyltransferase [Paenibacillus dendritiformis]